MTTYILRRILISLPIILAITVLQLRIYKRVEV